MDDNLLRQSATDAIGYWETRRLLYNAVLAAVVVFCFGAEYPASRAILSIDKALFLFVLAVLANVAYCAAYIVDLFAQASSYGDHWRRRRWALFAVGLSFASVVTRFWFLGRLMSTQR